MRHEVTRQLRIMNLLHAPDAAVITAYVVIVEKLDRLRARMTSEPEVVRNPANGMPMPNPVFDQWLKACTKMESLATSSGSTRRPVGYPGEGRADRSADAAPLRAAVRRLTSATTAPATVASQATTGMARPMALSHRRVTSAVRI